MKYLSLSEYARQFKMNVNTVKHLIYTGELKAIRTEGGHYKIAVYDDNTISFEKYEQLLQENEKLKTIIKNIKSILEEN